MPEPPENSPNPENYELGAAAQPLLAVGKTVPGLSSWVLERKLGGGGFGEVWLVKHGFTDELRAIKFCTHPVAKNQLVSHEQKVVARVMKHAQNHPNIVPLLEHKLDGEMPWLMYEYIDGGTLAEVIDGWKPLSVAERIERTIRTLLPLTAALGKFHLFTPPLIHRDLKPLNVLMAGEVPRITDFGIGGAAVVAAISDSKSRDSVALPTMLLAAGSGGYASPEQMFGSEPNPRDDVYSLGVIAYQMIVADRRYAPGADANDELRDLKVPTALVTLIVSSVALKADRRPKDASVWETALTRMLPRAVPVRIPATPSSPPVPPRPPVRVAGDVIEVSLPGELKISFCWVPPGSAQLGSPKAEQEAVAKQAGKKLGWLAAESEAKRGVFTSTGFWMAKNPVTQAEWYSITGETPSYFQPGTQGATKVQDLDTSRFPVEQVSWDMICGKGGFLEKLNAIAGREKVFGKAGRFALPHEDMWEYACRGGLGNQQPFYWGKELNGIQANIDGTHPFGTTTKGPSLKRSCAVDDTNGGKYRPHPWGLMHMHGNVWEWCENLYDNSSNRVLRGGSWGYFGRFGRAAFRYGREPDDLNWGIGFRLCLPWTA